MTIESLFSLIALVLRLIPVLLIIFIFVFFLLWRLENRSGIRRQEQMEHLWSVGTLPDGVSFDRLVFRDELYGLAFGNRRGMAWAYRTTDGGEQWQIGNSLGIGSTEAACIVAGETVFALQELGDDPRRVVLSRSNDGGVTWEAMNTPCESRYLHFMDGENGVMWNNPELDEQRPALYSTRDGAKTWDRIDIRSDTMLLDCAIANDGSVYYLRGVERRNLASGPAEPLFRYAFQLVRLVPAQGRWDEECDELPVGVAGIKIYIDGWSVWIGVNDPEKYWHGPNRLGRWIGSGQFEVVDHQFPAIHSVSFNGSAITMLCGGSGGSSDFHWKMGGGSPPATFYVYRSEDVGRSWRCETSPIGMDRPAALLGDHVWGIGLGNRLYHKRVHV